MKIHLRRKIFTYYFCLFIHSQYTYRTFNIAMRLFSFRYHELDQHKYI